MKKLLVIRFSSIGDIVLTTPVIRCMKQQMPDAEIHYLTKEQFVPVLAANPYIDKIFSIKRDIAEVIPRLKKENYDQVIDLHKNFRSKGVIIKLQKSFTTFNKINVKKWLIVRFKIDKLPRIHIVDRYFDAVKNLGLQNDQKGLDYFIPKEDVVDLKTFPSGFQNGYIGWVIGGKHNTKIYPEEKIIEVLNCTKRPVVLLGGPEDREKGERIKKSSGEFVFNACGRFTINQSASLVQQAEIIVTNDTGLMHFAAAFKKETISLWGNTIPEFGMYPYLPGDAEKSTILEVKGLSCRPCSKLGFKECPKGHFKCMNDIDTQILVHKLNS
ncbi:MAG: glycosyltransferase family 9 protein [Bacteroidales bacterium]|nr:glycosyltransferase family 9 protein [Bacteroidales bacterium]